MSAWVLTKGLQNLRAQIDAWAPDRDHASDGTIGDAAHQAETSGHNPDDTAGVSAEWNGDPDSTAEVRAIDVDVDFRNGATAQQLVDHVVALKPSSVLRYVIYNRRIYEASNGWDAAGRPYTGASAHTEHIHFSGAYSQSSDENTTYDYRLGEIYVPLTDADIDAIADRVLNKAGISIPTDQTWSLGSTGRNTYVEAKNSHTMGDRNAATLAAMDDKLDALAAAVAALTPPADPA